MNKRVIFLVLVMFLLSFYCVMAVELIEEDIGDYEYEKEADGTKILI